MWSWVSIGNSRNVLGVGETESEVDWSYWALWFQVPLPELCAWGPKLASLLVEVVTFADVMVVQRP